MMTKAGYKTWLGGNIGNPVLDMAGDMTENDWVILELSSFQLHTMKKTPERAVITNLSPNHLDWHTDYAEYIDAKTNIFKNMAHDDILVLNADNSDSAALLPMAHVNVKFFSRRTKASVWLDGDTIRRGNDDVLDIKDIKIPGMHNVENYMAAIAAVEGLVSNEVIVDVAKSFGGVPHRLELVREKDGVRYYNSSIDSSPNRTINALSVFDQKIIMLSGGKDKGIPYDAIGDPIADHVKTLILISKIPVTEEDKHINPTAGQIKKAVLDTGRSDIPEIIEVHTYEDAVAKAAEKAVSGDIVLLSPASTSFDMFRNFEERGNLFKKLVNEL
jgi:UDP-N-acetylmuramoylalanine--D-glutamate ligase